jgi:beta-xylosidase
MMKTVLIKCSFFILIIAVNFFPLKSQIWQPDNGDGTYKNPIIYADYSDPDVIRVNDDFYMVASSFNCVPGIPVLHSKDLVNWEIIGHVYQKLPLEKYNHPQLGGGSWAPSIRYHNGIFYVYFCTPDDGLFMASTSDPAKNWTLIQVADVVNWEDPCPIWDDNGDAFLVHSKLCGGILYLHKLSPDGTKLLDNGTIIFDDQKNQPTIEGPKFLKKNGYYYIIAPAGGVEAGWQSALRSKNIYGPYEQKIVLHQGNTDINGPHQGGIVDLTSGEWWFIHFQDKDAYGRIEHLQPVKWVNDWPIIGVDINGDGIGEPVSYFKKPSVTKKYSTVNPQTSDEFNSDTLGLQWQWWANPQPQWFSLSTNTGVLRLYANQVLTENGNPWYAPNLLLQKFPAPTFSATTFLTFNPQNTVEKAGLIIMGESYSFIAISKSGNKYVLAQYLGDNNICGGSARVVKQVMIDSNNVYLRVAISQNASCSFFYSIDGKGFLPLGSDFTAKQGKWIGAKIGVFCINPSVERSNGYADFDWFRTE